MTPLESSSLEPRTVIVLAGRRGGPDALAQAAGASHRALLEIEGEPMLARVTRRLLGRPGIDRVLVNIDTPRALDTVPFLKEAIEAGRVEILESAESPSRSVLESLDAAGLEKAPVLVTTADHALLDDEMLDAFFASARRREGADLCLAMVPRRIIEARFPEAKRTYLRFKEDGYSGANLFLFRTPAARRAAEFWLTAERERKKPWRLARAFGWSSLALFLTRQLTLETAMQRASKVVGARIEAIALETAEAAVDVDKIEDLELVRQILANRSSST